MIKMIIILYLGVSLLCAKLFLWTYQKPLLYNSITAKFWVHENETYHDTKETPKWTSSFKIYEMYTHINAYLHHASLRIIKLMHHQTVTATSQRSDNTHGTAAVLSLSRIFQERQEKTKREWLTICPPGPASRSDVAHKRPIPVELGRRRVTYIHTVERRCGKAIGKTRGSYTAASLLALAPPPRVDREISTTLVFSRARVYRYIKYKRRRWRSVTPGHAPLNTHRLPTDALRRHVTVYSRSSRGETFTQSAQNASAKRCGYVGQSAACIRCALTAGKLYRFTFFQAFVHGSLYCSENSLFQFRVDFLWWLKRIKLSNGTRDM